MSRQPGPDALKGSKVPVVKVCGMTREADVDACLELGVDLLGFIFHQPSPRCTTPAFAARFADKPVERVGVFVRQTADEVRRIMDQGRLTLAQLHGDPAHMDEGFCRAVGPERVIRALWPERYGSVEDLAVDLERFGPVCRFFLLDAGTSGGGHGRAMDFSRLRDLRSPRPWLLAGGLGPDNLDEALASCRGRAGVEEEPGFRGVDLNSGVEDAPGVKSRARLSAALEILRRHRRTDALERTSS